MSDLWPPIPDPEDSFLDRFRLNPHFFLSERKLWIVVSLLLLLLGYGFIAHMMAMYAGYQAHSFVAYPIALSAMLAVPMILHAIAPLQERRGAFQVIATFRAGEEHFRFHHGKAPLLLPTDERDLESLAQQIGLGPTGRAALFALLTQVQSVFDEVAKQAAMISGRSAGRRHHPTIRLIILNKIGSPYCHASLLGRVDIVFPLGYPLLSPPPQDLLLHMRALLAHELAHALVHDQPLRLFSDANLLAWESALKGAASGLFWVLLAALPFPAPRSALPSHVQFVVPALALFLCVSAAGLSRLKRRLHRRLDHHGLALLLTLAIAAAVLLLWGALLSHTGLVNAAQAPIGTIRWPMAVLTLGLVLLLSQLYVRLGRRQIEIIADETAICALARADRKTTARARDEMIAALDELAGRIQKAGWNAIPVPRFALGHSVSFAEVHRGSAVADFLGRLSAALMVKDRGPLLRLLARISDRCRSAWEEIIIPLWRTHPSLFERKDLILHPDHQVEQNPSIPLVYITMPILIFPALLGLIGHASPLLNGILEGVPVALFLVLFSLVARRPTCLTRTVTTVNTSSAAFLTGLSVPLPPPLPVTTPRQVLSDAWRDVRAWWQAPFNDSPKLHSGRGEQLNQQRTAPSLLEEVGLASRALFLACVLSTLIVRAAGGSLPLPLTEIRLPSLTHPISLLCAALLETAFLLGWYLLWRFFHLAQWHYYQGGRWSVWLWCQFINVIKTTIVWLFSIGVMASVVYVAKSGIVLRSAAPLFPAALNDHRLFWEGGALLATGWLLLALSYAGVICRWPTLPRVVICPKKHEVLLSWHDVLSRPTDPEDAQPGAHVQWAWTGCASCRWVPQARKHLISDDDNDVVAWRRSPSWSYALLGLFILLQGAVLVWGWQSSHLTLGVARNCRTLAALQPPPGAEPDRFLDCAPAGAPTDFIADVPARFAVLVQGARPGQQGELYQTERWSSDSLLEHALEEGQMAEAFPLLWSCADWMALLRNQVAYLQACAQTRPAAPMAECTPQAVQERPEEACRCLWAFSLGRHGDAPGLPAISEPLRISALAALRLYQPASRLLHMKAVARACGNDTRAQAQQQAWHNYVERELAPRWFQGIAAGHEPAYLFTTTQAMYEPASPECAHIVDHGVKDFQKAHDPACAQSPPEGPSHCLEGKERFEKKECAALFAQVKSCQEDPSHSKECAERFAKSREQFMECEVLAKWVQGCHGCLGAQDKWQADHEHAPPSCAAILTESELRLCDGLPGNDPACAANKIVPRTRECRARFQPLFRCLSRDAVRQRVLEAQSVIAVQRAYNELPERLPERPARLRQFADAWPALQAMKETAEEIERLLGALEHVRELDRGACEAAAKKVAGLRAQAAILSVAVPTSRALDHLSPPPVNIAAQVRELERTRLCTYARSAASLGFPTSPADQWQATLACPSIPDGEVVHQCHALDRLIEQSVAQPQRDPHGLGIYCQKAHQGEAASCRRLLGIPAGCDEPALTQTRREARAVLYGERPFSVLLTSPVHGGADQARTVSLLSLRARLGCAGAQGALEDALCTRHRRELADQLKGGSEDEVPDSFMAALGFESSDGARSWRESKPATVHRTLAEMAESSALRACQPFSPAQRQELIVELDQLRREAIRGMVEPINQLAGLLPRVDSVLGEYFSVCRGRGGAEHWSDCMSRLAPLLNDVLSPSFKRDCLDRFGHEEVKMAIGVILNADRRNEIRGLCDLPTRWTLALSQLREKQSSGRLVPPLPPQETYEAHQLIADLAVVAQLAGLPEYFEKSFRGVRGHFDKEKERP